MTSTRRRLIRLARIVSVALPNQPFFVYTPRVGLLSICVRRGWRNLFLAPGLTDHLYATDSGNVGSVVTVGHWSDSDESLSASLVAALSRPGWFLNP